MLTESQKNELILSAISAPSADNSQPFQFHWHNNSLDLWIDKQRSGKASDNRFILSDMALGAIIETLVIKADALTLNHQVTYFPEGLDNKLFVAQLTFSSSKTAQIHALQLAKAIPKRCTDRRFPFKGPIEPHVQDLLQAAAQQHDCHLSYFDDKASLKKVVPIIQQAEAIRFKSKILHHEVFSTINFDNNETPDGLSLPVLAIERPMWPLFKQMSKWSVMSILNKIGAATLLSIRSVRIPIMLSPALVLLSTKNKERIDLIKAGRALQRIWLQATVEKLSIHPYAAPGVLSLGFVQCEKELKNELTTLTQTIKTISSENNAIIFLRIGYNKEIKHRSLRRALASFRR